MQHEVVSGPEWVRARKALLEKEKELTRAQDALARARRALPWERVDERYVFDTAAGEASLAELFGERSQLVVYHLMFAPDASVTCKSCAFWADHFSGIVAHLAQRDVAFIAVSRAPLDKLLAFKQRLGWTFPWVSSGRCDFNFDYHVSFAAERGQGSYNYGPRSQGGSDLPGISVFCKDAAGAVFHTYSTYGRGIEVLNAAYGVLDLVPKGRDEERLAYPMAWVNFHDQYGAGA